MADFPLQTAQTGRLCLNKHAVVSLAFRCLWATHQTENILKTTKQHAASQRPGRLTFPIQFHSRNVTLWDGIESFCSLTRVWWAIDGSLSWSEMSSRGIWWGGAGLGSVWRDVLLVEIHLGRIKDFLYRVNGQMMVTSLKWWGDFVGYIYCPSRTFRNLKSRHSCVSRSDFPLLPAQRGLCVPHKMYTVMISDNKVVWYILIFKPYIAQNIIPAQKLGYLD